MRSRHPWPIMIGVCIVGGGAWLIGAAMVSPGHNGPVWRSLELSLVCGGLIAVAFAWSRMAKADVRHLRRLVWERDGRCGACGFALDPGATACPACTSPVTPRPPGSPAHEPCPRCGYPLDGIRGDRCPECGTLVPPSRT